MGYDVIIVRAGSAGCVLEQMMSTDRMQDNRALQETRRWGAVVIVTTHRRLGRVVGWDNDCVYPHGSEKRSRVDAGRKAKP